MSHILREWNTFALVTCYASETYLHESHTTRVKHICIKPLKTRVFSCKYVSRTMRVKHICMSHILNETHLHESHATRVKHICMNHIKNLYIINSSFI